MNGRGIILAGFSGLAVAATGVLMFAPSSGPPAPLAIRPVAVRTPTMPTDLQASAVSANQVDLTWRDNATNEDGFRIWRRPDYDQDGTQDQNEPWTLIAERPPNTTNTGEGSRRMVWKIGAGGTPPAYFEARRFQALTGIYDESYGIKRIEKADVCNARSSARGGTWEDCEWQAPPAGRDFWYEVRACASAPECGPWVREPELSCYHSPGSGCPCEIWPAPPECGP